MGTSSIELRRFFTKEAIAASLANMPPLRTQVMDLIYPEANRVNHPLPVVGYQDMGLPSGNIPVVKRGTQSYPLVAADGSLGLIEPQPVNPSTFLTAADINNMKMLDGQGQQQLIDNKLDNLRRACRATTEALAAQSLTGSISYPMRAEGGTLLTYQIGFGTPASVAIDAANYWDAAGTKLAHIIKQLGQIADELKKTAPGSDIVFACGFDVYAALIDKVSALNNSSMARVENDAIVLGGGIKVTLLSGTYTDLAAGTPVPVVAAKTIIAVDRSAGFRLFYAALDNLEAGLVAMPFFATQVESKDPSGIKIIGESKPLPVPNVKAIVTARVIA